MSAKHTPYFHPTVHRADPCGCSSEGDGTLRDPFHVKRCATHDSGPRLLRESADLLAALESIPSCGGYNDHEAQDENGRCPRCGLSWEVAGAIWSAIAKARGGA